MDSIRFMGILLLFAAIYRFFYWEDSPRKWKSPADLSTFLPYSPCANFYREISIFIHKIA